jgi:hypothetical protein
MKHLHWISILALLYTILILTGCNEPPAIDPFNEVYPKGHLAPTPTGPPIYLPKSACDTAEFDRNPKIEVRMTTIEEPTRLRGILFFSSSVATEPKMYDYVLRGETFDETLKGRIVEIYGEVLTETDLENQGVFLVRSYEVIPYAVLTGQLSIAEKICRELCSDWLLFEVEQDGKSYTYALSSYSNLYPILWERAGTQVNLAVDIYPDRDFMHYYVLEPRFFCDE